MVSNSGFFLYSEIILIPDKLVILLKASNIDIELFLPPPILYTSATLGFSKNNLINCAKS